MFALRKLVAEPIRLGVRSKATLPSLGYGYEALEPVISREIMEIHHTKHHQAYVTNYNAALENLGNATKNDDPTKIIALQGALRFNGGGHINHSIFWQNLSPSGGKPSKELETAISASFGGMEQMKSQLSTASVAVQGSGWGWLGYNKATGRLQVVACPNQDPLEATTGLIPLFGIDVWEHAYYLQYKNVRADYVKNIFEVANWNDISQRFANASKK